MAFCFDLLTDLNDINVKNPFNWFDAIDLPNGVKLVNCLTIPFSILLHK